MQRAGKAKPVEEAKALPVESENEQNSSGVSSQTGDEHGGHPTVTTSQIDNNAEPAEPAVCLHMLHGKAAAFALLQ